ncbi:hypothetical protein PsorP6_016254 [Peronosclerospora sorghi]|uniref:Uncharacterized protein n=1 Tax=Peronosclerospora sorghi TaxID=230839 RepID=A0ACC0VLF2_9STRA|nr:hypothetical protein PsorP6_016254 [Peronosclerospora sorghi]
MSEFDALWESLETLARDVKRPTDPLAEAPKKSSLLEKWLASVVDHYAFRQIIHDLRAQEKETMSTLNAMLEFLVARVSSLFKERSLVHCGSCKVGRQLVKLVREFLQQPHTVKKEPIELGPTRSSMVNQKRSFDALCAKGDNQRDGLFPNLSETERAVKTQKLCSLREWVFPSVEKLRMVAPVASRSRVFAEVDF